MSVNIRYPNITASTPTEQLAQLKSYLYQLVDELNYALPNAGTGDGSAPSTYQVQGGEMSYYELRSLIIQEIQEVENLFDQLEDKMLSEYVKDEEMEAVTGKLGDLITEAKTNLVAAINELARRPSGGIIGGDMNITDDGNGHVAITVTPGSTKITDDGYGNVTIT